MPPIRQCRKCILNTNDDPAIVFDQNGVCNYCKRVEQRLALEPKDPSVRKKKLQDAVQEIRASSARSYDSVLGVSGGVDSTYLAYAAKKLGLNPLLVHFDNGWNSELAVKNIEQIVEKLGFDLYTYVNDWAEFKDIQLAYLHASVVDIEVPTDHGIMGSLYRTAAKYKIRYIIEGSNYQTESVLPYHWVYPKLDDLNLKAIHRAFGKVKLRTFPLLNAKMGWYYNNVLRIRRCSLLEYMDYNKEDAKKIIQAELGWRDYGGKHYESIWTRFYQGYILYHKFGIDKRKAHLSNLIAAGQMTREEALSELQQPIYDPDQLEIDKDFVFKKFGLTEKIFNQIMQNPPRGHRHFPHRGPLYYRFYPLLLPLRPLRKFYNKIRTPAFT